MMDCGNIDNLRLISLARCKSARHHLLDVAVVIGNPQFKQRVLSQRFPEVNEERFPRPLDYRKDIRHFEFNMPVVADYGPSVVGPCHRSKECLSPQCRKRGVCVSSCSEEHCYPSVVSKIEQVCMTRALDVMPLAVHMREYGVERTLLIRSVDIPASECADMMACAGSAFCKNQVVPAVAEVDVRGFGGAPAAAPGNGSERLKHLTGIGIDEGAEDSA